MPVSDIVIKGAREHNLQNVDLILPRNQLICLTGVSGSGKSSLAFDTIYAEGQRRYVESLSSFARHFLGQMPKPDVDLIQGLSPSISIAQKSAGNNPRSTVGTITEIYDYLRVLFARVGQGFCPKCCQPISAQSREQIIAHIMALPTGSAITMLAPLVRGQKGEYKDLFDDLLKQGYIRARVDGVILSLSDPIRLDRQLRHDIEVVIDRITVKPSTRGRVAEAVEMALAAGNGSLLVSQQDGAPQAASAVRSPRRKPRDRVFSAQYACTTCGLGFEPPSPQLFSFNSPQGMCLECDGLGQLYSFDPSLLVPDPSLSFKRGCFPLLGAWNDLGRWRRHIYQGVADTIERVRELGEGTLLETPWEDLPDPLRAIWLSGTGDAHITYTWRGGSSPMKYGGTFEGIVPELHSRYRSAKSAPKRRQLESYMNNVDCADCGGQRLNAQARNIRLYSADERFAQTPWSLPEVCHLSVSDARAFFQQLVLDSTQELVASEALKEIRNRLDFLLNVGLNYLTLDRTAPTLSGGESQRIRLAGQIGSGLVGVLYILDEPSIGLHWRDNHRLLQTLMRLRDQGNTVLVVEHDEDTMRAADHLIDFGPGPGVRGGRIVAQGPPGEILRNSQSVTADYLRGKRSIPVPRTRRQLDLNRSLRVIGAAHNNLKNIDVTIPLGGFVCVTGVSGSGKSSLVNDILVEALRRDLNRGLGEPGRHKRLEGIQQLDKLIAIDQSPIGRTPRSNPGTYIKVFDEIRHLFAQLPDAKRRGYAAGRFSFNVKTGRCQACEGNGSNKLEMDFLADVWVTCPVCQGHRFNRETLQVRYRGKTISDVLEMDVQQALELFQNIPKINDKLQTLHDVGLDYIKIGQPSPTLSGGEAQRIKLARELVKKSTGKTLYLLDEPTTGLHFADIQMLLKVLHDFVDAGNTVLVVEHNLDVIKTADWVIDLGPEGGQQGGQMVAAGTPEHVAQNGQSYTGAALASVLNKKLSDGRTNGRSPRKKSAPPAPKIATQIQVRGAQQHNLRSVDVQIDRDRMTTFCGPSGSGKSSLAMDTIYAEGQRRYVESLSAYARQFVNQMQKPKVEHIEGLSPAIAIEQKNMGSTPRSTVGTVTEIYDYLRILFSRLGVPYCPQCDTAIGTQTCDQIVDKVLQEPAGTQMYILAPVSTEGLQSYVSLWSEIRSAGYIRVRIDGQTFGIDEAPDVSPRSRHQVEIVVDRIVADEQKRSRITDSVEAALSIGNGVIRICFADKGTDERHWRTVTHSQHLACNQCGRSFQLLTPHHFSFNSPLGWCPDCEGIGTQVGANTSAMLSDPEASLAEGAVLLWPSLDVPIAKQMIQALASATGLPLDVPFDQLAARHRRIVLYGTGEKWFQVAGRGGQPQFSFQYKGLYPTLEEASRMSPSLRKRMQSLIDTVECGTCAGSRLRDDAGAMQFQQTTIDGLCRMPLGLLNRTIASWKLDPRQQRIAGEVMREVVGRVQFLIDVGLEYLTLARTAATLSNGEAQRIRLASQLGSGLCGVLYVLDEPTIGLHPRDNQRLLSALHKLRDLGNTLLVVEHDREVISNSDQVCDFGPRAGVYGGQIVAQGTPSQLARKRRSVTGPYLNGKKAIPVPSNRRPGLEMPAARTSGRKSSRTAAISCQPVAQYLEVVGARQHNLKNLRVQFPLGALSVVTGPSGCGKSSLVDDVLYRALAQRLHRASVTPGAHDRIRGIEQINKVIRVDQQPLGNSPTSNPATYTGAFELIRMLFAQLPDAKVRGYSARRFSFNVPGGRCEACEGNGQRCIEMHFLPDVWVRCETCQGRRYNDETLAVRFHGKSISDVLDMTCAQAAKLFANIPKIQRILQMLCDVGLEYLTIGQAAPTLSGGEAQRVKLAAELSRPDTGRTLYLLDEPTTGLHFDDLSKLLDVLHRLVDVGNTVVLIEHNLDVIKSADWVIDLGPEAGHAGGHLVCAGPPEAIVRHAKMARRKANRNLLRSYTGEALEPVLAAGPCQLRKEITLEEHLSEAEGLDITEVGRQASMPWESDGRSWHLHQRVDRKGQPVRWDGRILEKVVERIERQEGFSETNWNARTLVEVNAATRSRGWFLHAITGETWLLKMKFRCRRGTFKREELLQQIPLATFNQLDELPIYGNQPRLKVINHRGPWQEVEIRAYRLDELDTPAFWDFVDRAIASFLDRTQSSDFRVEDHMPWTKLGQKWHFLRKGFPPGQKIHWEVEVLEVLHDLLKKTAPHGQFLWNNKQIVHVFVPDQKEPWASIQTKKCDAVWLQLTGPRGVIALGAAAGLGRQPTLKSVDSQRDILRIGFESVQEVENSRLKDLLQQHLDRVKDS